MKNTEIKFDRFDGCNWSYGQKDFRYQHGKFEQLLPITEWRFVEGTEVVKHFVGIGNLKYVEPGRYNVFEREVELQ